MPETLLLIPLPVDMSAAARLMQLAAELWTGCRVIGDGSCIRIVRIPEPADPAEHPQNQPQ